MYNPFLVSIAVADLPRRRRMARWHHFALALRELTRLLTLNLW